MHNEREEDILKENEDVMKEKRIDWRKNREIHDEREEGRILGLQTLTTWAAISLWPGGGDDEMRGTREHGEQEGTEA